MTPRREYKYIRKGGPTLRLRVLYHLFWVKKQRLEKEGGVSQKPKRREYFRKQAVMNASESSCTIKTEE